MSADYPQVVWCDQTRQACRELARLAMVEDLGDACDWTSHWIVPPGRQATAKIVARRGGVVAGLACIDEIIEVFAAQLVVDLRARDGDTVASGAVVAQLRGLATDLLTIERTLLNFLGRLSGVATLTRQYVDAVHGTSATIYDTRKTTPGWRLLEKYAVGQGGGRNHRLGLHQAVMIKDNHVALAADHGFTLAEALRRIREQQRQSHPTMVVEVEVDSLDQLQMVLPERPDIVLLDNMNTATLAAAVAMRNKLAENVVLEASGGVTLATVAAIAATGVDRISSGALTHSAINFDFGLDWLQS
jgi:nicotinate-nucleotide pyrophosphorylase (carboxylating)